MTVNLRQYLDQEVQVTYENGDTDIGKVSKNPNVYGTSELKYHFSGSKVGSCYTKDGFFWSHRGPNTYNITKIKPFNMKKYEQLENQIKELQAEVERLKKEEESKLPKGFSREAAIAFLEEPSSRSLDNAFTWEDTPQGITYWYKISGGDFNNSSYKVPQEAILAIQSWVIESYKEQYGV